MLVIYWVQTCQEYSAMRTWIFFSVFFFDDRFPRQISGEILALLGHNGAGKFDTQRPTPNEWLVACVALPKVDHSIDAHRGSATDRGMSWVFTKGEVVLGFLFVGSLLCFFILVLPLGSLCVCCLILVQHAFFPTSEGLAPWQIIVCSMHLLRQLAWSYFWTWQGLGNHSLFLLVAGFDFLMQHDDKWHAACHSCGCGTRDVTILAPSHIATLCQGRVTIHGFDARILGFWGSEVFDDGLPCVPRSHSILKKPVVSLGFAHNMPGDLRMSLVCMIGLTML